MLVLVIGTAGAGYGYAAEPPQTMAQYFPAATDAFAVLRTDADTRAALDAFWLRVTTPFPEGGITFSDALNRALQPEGGVNLISFLGTWLGDYGAVGIDGVEVLFDSDLTNDDDLRLLLVAQIDNVTSATLALLGGGLLADSEQAQRDGFTTYISPAHRRAVALNRDLLIISLNSTELPLNLDKTLAEQPAFQSALGDLPADRYDALGYVDTPMLTTPFDDDASIGEVIGALGFDMAKLQATAIGITLLDDLSAAVDIAQAHQPPAAESIQAIDPAFARFIPAETSFMMQATDLSKLASMLASLRASLSASDTADDTFAKLEELTQLLLKLDLNEDILRWTTGNYSIFVDFVEGDGIHPLHFGLMIEATDPTRARQLTEALGTAAAQFVASDSTRVQSEQMLIEGAPPVAITRIDSDSASGRLDIAIGTDDEIFFLGTYSDAYHVLNAGDALEATGTFSQARGYLLENPLLLLYLDGDGFGRLASTGYNLLAPTHTIGDLLGIGLDVLPDAPPEAFAPYFNVIRSSSISTAHSARGSLILRWVVTLAE
jgi:hypothetical protein